MIIEFVSWIPKVKEFCLLFQVCELEIYASSIGLAFHVPLLIVPTVVIFSEPFHVDTSIFSTLFKSKSIFNSPIDFPETPDVVNTARSFSATLSLSMIIEFVSWIPKVKESCLLFQVCELDIYASFIGVAFHVPVSMIPIFFICVCDELIFKTSPIREIPIPAIKLLSLLNWEKFKSLILTISWSLSEIQTKPLSLFISPSSTNINELEADELEFISIDLIIFPFSWII